MAFVFSQHGRAHARDATRLGEELAVAGEREEQMLQANRTLSDLYRMRSVVMRDISHDANAPHRDGELCGTRETTDSDGGRERAHRG